MLPGVEIVAIADSNAQLAQEKAAQFAPAATIYTDAMEMLEKEQLDVLWSVVPAFTRAAGVEAAAAAKGIHIFTEKPQATVMRHAVEIADAVREAGVLSTVGFRERYRPLFQEARSFLADKTITHARFQSIRVLPEPNPPPPGHEDDWHYVMAKAGGPMFDWGCHAVDYMRFVTGLDVVAAQAFYNHPDEWNKPLTASFNYQFESGATFTSTFICSLSPDMPVPEEPNFVVFFEGGFLTIEDPLLKLNGEVLYDVSRTYAGTWAAIFQECQQ